MGRLFSIPLNQPFAKVFSGFLLENYQQDTPFGLADATVYVPSPRQGKVIARELLKTANKEALLMPRFATFSVIPEEFQEVVASPLVRQMMFVRWLTEKEPNLSQPQKLKMAKSLSDLWNKLVVHQTPLEKLKNLVPIAHASHWGEHLEFLKIMADEWPKWLHEKRIQDSALAAQTVLESRADEIKKSQKPILAAGFSDTTPQGMALLKHIFDREDGVLVLPFVDTSIPLEKWEKLPPEHPQYGLQNILKGLGATQDEVCFLGEEKRSFWPHLFDDLIVQQEELPPLPSLCEVESTAQEAETIALVMRQAIEEKGKTCALVAPDRALAQQVADQLLRWDIVVDDSAGIRLSETSVGSLFQLIAQVAAQGFRPLLLMTLLRHPLARFGQKTKAWKEKAAELEKILLRGEAPPVGLEGLKQKLRQLSVPPEKRESLLNTLDELSAAFAPFLKVKTGEPLNHFVEGHKKAFQNIAGKLGGHEEAQNQLVQLVEEVSGLPSDGIIPLDFSAYAETIGALLAEETVRLPAAHPRLFIWGPLEARLQQVDTLILGGMNEGGWPHLAVSDAWLSRAMQAQLGLPLPERAVGLNAFDFLSLVGAHDNVILTRALRDENGPTLPSRMLARLQIAVGKDHFQHMKNEGQIYIEQATALWRQGHGDVQPLTEAKANVPLENRPKQWSPSLLRDVLSCPYKVYAGKVLGLKQAEDWEAEMNAADKGTLIHTILQAFFRTPKDAAYLPAPWKGEIVWENRAEMEETFLEIAKAAFAKMGNHAARHVWWPRMERLIPAIVKTLIQQKEQGRTISVEDVEREAVISFKTVSLKARADRLDEVDGSTVVVDYKTGSTLPSAAKNNDGREPQLGVEAWMVNQGAFGERRRAAMPEYWHVSGREADALEVRGALESPRLKMPLHEWLAMVEEGLNNVHQHMMEAQAPFEALPGDAVGKGRKDQCLHCDFAGVCRFRDWEAQDV